MRVSSLDHFVLTVRNVAVTCEFYSNLLGLQVVTFGEGRKALALGSQKINLHEQSHEFEPHAGRPTPGAADFCMVIDGSLDEFIAHAQSFGAPIILGPEPRAGALGPIRSVYLRDPDENLIEVAVYQPGAAH